MFLVWRADMWEFPLHNYQWLHTIYTSSWNRDAAANISTVVPHTCDILMFMIWPLKGVLVIAMCRPLNTAGFSDSNCVIAFLSCRWWSSTAVRLHNRAWKRKFPSPRTHQVLFLAVVRTVPVRHTHAVLCAEGELRSIFCGISMSGISLPGSRTKRE